MVVWDRQSFMCVLNLFIYKVSVLISKTTHIPASPPTLRCTHTMETGWAALNCRQCRWKLQVFFSSGDAKANSLISIELINIFFSLAATCHSLWVYFVTDSTGHDRNHRWHTLTYRWYLSLSFPRNWRGARDTMIWSAGSSSVLRSQSVEELNLLPQWLWPAPLTSEAL